MLVPFDAPPAFRRVYFEVLLSQLILIPMFFKFLTLDLGRLDTPMFLQTRCILRDRQVEAQSRRRESEHI